MSRPPASQLALRVRGVRKTFDGRAGQSLEVLQGIDLNVAAGESVSILGPSGCGKSTLLRLVAGLEPLTAADSGDILVDGAPAGQGSGDVGFVFQSYSSFPWLTVRENVLAVVTRRRIAAPEREDAVSAQLAAVRLTEFASAYPEQLSGGQRQRLAFACALAMEPKLLLLDEPMGALDALTREHLQVELLRLWLTSRRSMVLVTHDINEALLLGQRVIVFSDRPATIVLDLDARLDKPWLGGGVIDPGRLEAFTRETRKSRSFLDLADQLRDALSH